MSTVAVLDIPVRADTSNLDAGLAKSQKAVADFASQTEQAGAKGGAAMSGLSLKSVAMAAAVGGAMSAAATAVIDFGKQVYAAAQGAIDGITQIGKKAEQFGIMAQDLGGLSHAAAMSGVGFEDLTGGLVKFQKSMVEVTEGNAEMGEVFQRLGLEARTLADLPVTEALSKFADAFAKTSSSAQQSRDVLKVFGKGAIDMKNVLAKGSEGLKDLSAEAQQLGLALDESQTAGVREASKAWLSFKEAMLGIARSLAVVFTPAFRAINETFRDVGATVATFVRDNIDHFQLWVKTGLAVVGMLFDIGSTIVSSVVGALSGLVGSTGTWDEWKASVERVLLGVQFAVANWKEYFQLGLDSVTLAVGSFVLDLEFQFATAWKVLQFFVANVGAFALAIAKIMATIGLAIGATVAVIAASVSQAISDITGKTGLTVAIQKAIGTPREKTEWEQGLIDRIKERSDRLAAGIKKAVEGDIFGKGAKIEHGPESGKLEARLAKPPAAAELGSKEAFSIIFGAQQSVQFKQLGVANQTLQVQTRMEKLLEKILLKQFGLGRARI